MGQKKKVEFHTYRYMLNKLRDKDLILDSDFLSIEILKSRGYYNLINRYKSEFSKEDNLHFEENVHITDLYYYHRVEDDLRNILFKFTINFEQIFKESMAYIISKDIGVETDQYLDFSNYRNYTKARKITKFISHQMEKCTVNPTLYYKKEYGDVPPWILLNNLTMGQTRMYFSIFPLKLTTYVVEQLLPMQDAMPSAHKNLSDFVFNEVLRYRPTDNLNEADFEKLEERSKMEMIELTRDMISIIVDFRNNLAHGSRLIHFTSRQSLNNDALRIFASNKVFSDSEFYSQGIGKNDLFSFIISLIILMDKFDSLYLIDQLDAWQKNNTRTQLSKQAFYHFLKSCNLAPDFISRLKKITIDKTGKQQNEEFNRRFDL